MAEQAGREGLVLKAYSNFVSVRCRATGYVFQCRLRGRLRHQGPVLTGDRVVFSPLEEGRGVVAEVLPRATELRRPPIANADLAVVVFSLKAPEVAFSFLDRLLVLIEAAGLDILLCLNKIDLIEPAEAAAVEETRQRYAQAGYPFLCCSARTGEGVEGLTARLRDRLSVFAGQSGVGKSRLLNAIKPGLRLKTGELGGKLHRGRHTTRHVELLPVGSGLVADTPGFGHLWLEGITTEELTLYFPEFEGLGRECRFPGCRHDQEPGCAIKGAVAAGGLPAGRYQNYLALLAEVRQWEADRWS